MILHGASHGIYVRGAQPLICLAREAVLSRHVAMVQVPWCRPRTPPNQPLTPVREKALSPVRQCGDFAPLCVSLDAYTVLVGGPSMSSSDSKHEGNWSNDALPILQPVPSGVRSRLWRLAFGMRSHLSAVAERGSAMGGLRRRARATDSLPATAKRSTQISRPRSPSTEDSCRSDRRPARSAISRLRRSGKGQTENRCVSTSYRHRQGRRQPLARPHAGMYRVRRQTVGRSRHFRMFALHHRTVVAGNPWSANPT